MSYKIIVFVVCLFAIPLRASDTSTALNIGYTGLPQQVSSQELAPGMQYIHIIRGQSSPDDYYTLSSGAISEKKAAELLQQLSGLGHKARTEPLAEFGLHGKPLGVTVRLGRFAKVGEAKTLAKALHQSGIPMAVRFTAEDGGPTTGPFDISILKVDLDLYQGNIISALAKDEVLGKEETSAIARRHRALAAVNAGFFSWEDEVGTVGDPAGIAVVNGALVSEATDGRAALVIQNDGPPKVWVAHNVSTKIVLQFDDAQWTVNGLNRKAGIILNCGNQGGEPITLPVHDFVCTNKDEIVVFDHHFGDVSAPGDGFEFRLNDAGEVSALRNTLGGAIPANGYLVQAKGAMASRLRQLVTAGMSAKISMKVLSDEGEIPLTKGLYVVNGGPTLLREGKMDFSARYKEGWETDFGDYQVNDTFVDKKDTATVGDQYSNSRAGFYHGWVVRRHPRTAIGITEDNILYVVVVYGRQPGISAGASLTDMTAILQSLGAKEAFNLDGGGSTAMLVQGKLTGPPSDKTGERPVGDALVFTAKKR